MPPLRKTLETPDVSETERSSSELAKRIQKLRWIGASDEADQLLAVLRAVEPAYGNPIRFRDTD
jgi:hypothetical protein